MSVKELREVLEAIAEGLDEDSLLCQEAIDAAKTEQAEENEPSDVTWPWLSLEPQSDECMSIQEHIETYWGVDYDSDAMPHFSR